MTGRPYEVLTKVRSGDRQVDVSVPESEALKHGTPVVLDDIASSGRTMIRAMERLILAETMPPVCVIIHAVFAGTSYEDIIATSAARVVTTDSIPHESNAISLADPLAKAIAHAMPEMVQGLKGPASKSKREQPTELKR